LVTHLCFVFSGLIIVVKEGWILHYVQKPIIMTTFRRPNYSKHISL